MTPTPRMITLDPSTPLPCSIYNPEHNEPCGNPATLAWVYERRHTAPPLLLEFTVQPICSDCVTRMIDRQ